LAMKVAVLAHSTKTLGGGLPELRRVLDAAGIHNPVWIELAKSKQVAGEVERVLRRGVELIIAWGGDGMVQRCLDAIGECEGARGGDPGRYVEPARIEPRHPQGHRGRCAGRAARRPAPARCRALRRRALCGDARRRLRRGDDQGCRPLKARLGRAAYVLSGAGNLGAESFEARIDVDGARWYRGPASCVLVANVGELFGGIKLFRRCRAR